MTDARALRDLLRDMTDWIGLVEQPAYGTNSIYDEVVSNFVPRILALAQPATPVGALDVERLARAIAHGEGYTASPGSQYWKDRAAVVAAEYARLAGVEK